MSIRTDLEWLGAHAHLFDYHTPEALRFRQELMAWWTGLDRDEPYEKVLWDRFLQLSGGPVEAACGLFARGDEDRAAYTARMRRGDQLGSHLNALPQAAITARCAEGLYLPAEQRFLGTVTGADRRGKLLAAALQQNAARAEKLVERLNAITASQQEVDRKRVFAPLTAAGGFRLWKAVVSLAFTVLGFAAVPLWVKTVIALVCAAMHGSFALSPVLVVLVLAVPVAVYGWKQTVWEVWFAGYRRCALAALAAANRGRQRHSNRLRQRIRQAQQQYARGGKPWRAAKTTALAGFAAQLPGWVQVGKNPRLRPGKPHWLRDSFCIYPEQGPGKRKNASWNGAWVLVQGLMGAVLFMVLSYGL